MSLTKEQKEAIEIAKKKRQKKVSNGKIIKK